MTTGIEGDFKSLKEVSRQRVTALREKPTLYMVNARFQKITHMWFTKPYMDGFQTPYMCGFQNHTCMVFVVRVSRP
jgi:hypothetical protein